MDTLKLILLLLIFLIGFVLYDVFYRRNVIKLEDNPYDKPEDLTIYENYPIKVMKSPVSGLGVFATRDIKKGETIEESPCINVMGKFHGQLPDYVFTSVKNPNTSSIVALGYASIYNHKDHPTAEWKVIDDYKMIITALEDIPKGNEIFTSYGDYYWSTRNIEKH
jgi:hypothetical protein